MMAFSVGIDANNSHMQAHPAVLIATWEGIEEIANCAFDSSAAWVFPVFHVFQPESALANEGRRSDALSLHVF